LIGTCITRNLAARGSRSGLDRNEIRQEMNELERSKEGFLQTWKQSVDGSVEGVATSKRTGSGELDGARGGGQNKNFLAESLTKESRTGAKLGRFLATGLALRHLKAYPNLGGLESQDE
jgi:hypothetical protein